MHAILRRWGRGLAALGLLGTIAACTFGREPAYDAAIAGELARLTAGTQHLFQDLLGPAPRTHADRAGQYRSLAAQAETVRLMSEARGAAVAPAGLIGRLGEIGASLPGLPDAIPAAGERLAEYRDATPAYMADYLRNLGLLEAHDRGATGDAVARIAAYQAALEAHRQSMKRYLAAFALWQAGAGPRPDQPGPAPAAPATALDPVQVALRRTALEDILRDALVYERDILNRNR